MSELKFSDLVEPVAVDQNGTTYLQFWVVGSLWTAMANTAGFVMAADTMIWICDEAVCS